MTASATKKPLKAWDEIPIRAFKDVKAWESWLAKHHAATKGIWLRIAKKASGLKSVTYAEALEIALCYGWIDAQKRGESDTTFLQRFLPRRPRSIWSKINRQKVEELIEAGRMKPAGLEQVERARKDGRMDAAYDSPKSATITPEFQSALNRNPRAKAFFETIRASNRYALLWRIQTARKAETRDKWIRKAIEMLEKGETIH
ncbi:MAG TPA: YdeI/OmpD-associated family protein [Gemmatimonadaceae bacterium]|nr:YdeI/OmpD-associated family protein [Gemmatimonadaceae bacterium]